MPRLVLAAVLLATFAGCDSDGIDRSGRDPLDTTRLAGTWVWEKTVSCGDGSTRCIETTPASAQRTETLTFTPASANGASAARVEGYFNGRTVGPVGYEVRIDHVDTVTRPIWSASIILADGSGYNETILSGNRLVISAAAVDGSETTYRRR